MPQTDKHNLQIIVDMPQMAMIRELSALKGVSMGAMIRGLVEAAFLHTVKHHPTCPDGQRCFVPQMHNPGETTTAPPQGRP